MQQYNELLNKILEKGEHRGDRPAYGAFAKDKGTSGVGTRSLAFQKLEFDLRDGFPLLTCRRMTDYWLQEFVAFIIMGSTHIDSLGKYKGIWEPWANERGWMGPMYGTQMRFLRGENDKRIDQLADVINGIKKNAESRSHCATTWNVEDLEHMALNPCHGVWQNFRVSNAGYLDAHFVQRSGDMGIGVPHNIAYYALLLELVAKETGKTARYMHYSIDDAHIYENQINQIKDQILRDPLKPPSVKINAPYQSLTVTDVVVSGYNAHSPIKFPPAAI